MDRQIKNILADGGICKPVQADVPRPAFPKPNNRRAKGILPGAPPRIDVPVPTQSPWAAIGLINLFMADQPVLVGTGFLCEQDVLVTARHNIVDKPHDGAFIWMGFDGHHNPHAPATTISAYAFHKDFDLAVLILSLPQSGRFILGGAPPADGNVMLAGYSMPHPDGSVRFSHGSGRITEMHHARFTYFITTREGDSGAPVFVGDGVPRVIGMHSETQRHAGAGNGGILFTPDVVSDIHALTDWARAQIGAA